MKSVLFFLYTKLYFFGKIHARYIKSGLILAAGRQGLALRFTELNKNAHPL